MLLAEMLQKTQGAAQTARVAPDAGGVVNGDGDAVVHGAPLFAPYGVCGVPPEGETALFVPFGDADACIGVLCGERELLAGEVAIYSAGGARITLKNNGSIVLNGLTITPEGQIVAKGGLT